MYLYIIIFYIYYIMYNKYIYYIIHSKYVNKYMYSYIYFLDLNGNFAFVMLTFIYITIFL